MKTATQDTYESILSMYTVLVHAEVLQHVREDTRRSVLLHQRRSMVVH